MRHCSIAVPNSKNYRVRVIVNSTSDQGSANWRGDYHRFVGMSYAQVLKNGVNRSVALLDHSGKTVYCPSVEKHAVSRIACAPNVHKYAGINCKNVTHKPKHDPVVRVNNQVSEFRDHINHSQDQYNSHEDGMVFSKYFYSKQIFCAGK